MATETLTAQIYQVVASQNGSEIPFEQPVDIQVTKSPIYAVYTLTYQQDFNSQPKEEVISSTILGCHDSFTSNDPTCSFQYDSQGNKIQDSQGFCCDCSFTQFLGIGENINRGNICHTLNLGTGSATAHCLRYEELWYSAFQISNYIITYDINITIQYSNKTNDFDVLKIGSESAVDSNKNKTVIARIIGVRMILFYFL